MPLDYADFAHYYDGSAQPEAKRREDFETFANIMECFARYFWGEGPTENALGIKIDSDTIALIADVESKDTLNSIFNEAAAQDAAGRLAR